MSSATKNHRRIPLAMAAISLVVLGLACGTGAHEGDDAGECSDGADNDRNGEFDCDDPGCAGAPDCQSAPDAEEASPPDRVVVPTKTAKAQRFVSASATRVRSAPSFEAETVNVLPFGTAIVTESVDAMSEYEGKKDYWHKLQDQELYVFGGLMVTEPPQVEKEYRLRTSFETEYGSSSTILVLASGRAVLAHDEGWEGGQALEYTQTGTYMSGDLGLKVSLAATTGKGEDGGMPSTEQVPALALTLQYEPSLEGFVNDDMIDIVNEGGWKLDRAKKAYVKAVPCPYTKGTCRRVLEYWAATK